MSDFDDDYLEDEEADFEYEEEDDEADENDVDLENVYYSAKSISEEDLDQALTMFQSIVDSEPEPGRWAFKALKQMFKTTYRAGQLSTALTHYQHLLKIINTAISRNDAEKSISNLLDLVSGISLGTPCTLPGETLDFLEHMYRSTLDLLNEINNDRVWLKTNLKLAKLYLDRAQYPRLSKVLKLLHSKSQSMDDDQRQGTQLLEILALEIQMYSQTKNSNKLKELYAQCLAVKSAIPSPRIMGIIRECGGKMYMSEGNWSEAQTAFFDSFKNFDDAGSPQRIHVLKYLVLANLLTQSQINPFDSQETKPYKTDPEITIMTDLVSAYQRKDIAEFETILRDHHDSIMADAFIREHIDAVLRSIRAQVLVGFIQPYTRVELSYLARHLRISEDEVEDLLVQLILDKRINGTIDQDLRRLDLLHDRVAPSTDFSTASSSNDIDPDPVTNAARNPPSLYTVMDQWAHALTKVNCSITAKLSARP